MELTNKEIYLIGQNFNEAFKDSKEYYPAKVSFYVQFNMKKIFDAIDIIEEVKNNIICHYGIYDEATKKHTFSQENYEKANQELEDLANLKQELDLYLLDLDDIEKMTFTFDQMKAILFMIKN